MNATKVTVNSSIKRVGAGVIIIAFLLLSSALSWGDIRLYVTKAATGVLTVKKYDSNANPVLEAPTGEPAMKSCYTPDLFWDLTIGHWVLTGLDVNTLPTWVATAPISGVFTVTAPPQSAVDCTNVANPINTITSAEGIIQQTCSSFTYNCGTCQSNSTMACIVAASSPSGCTGGSPVLSQSCTYSPPSPTCTTFTYNCGTCQSNSTMACTVATSSPSGCTGGSPVLSQSCTYGSPSPTCTTFTYNCGTCQSNNTMACTVATSSPSNCTGGNPVLSQTCTYSPPPAGGSEVPIYANYIYNSNEILVTVPANSTLYFTATVPSGETGSYLTASSLSQNGILDMLLVEGSQVLTPAAAAQYLSDMNAMYTQYSAWGNPIVRTYTSLNVWGSFSGGVDGDSLTLLQAAANSRQPISGNTTPTLAGKYYIGLVNISDKSNLIKLGWKHY